MIAHARLIMREYVHAGLMEKVLKLYHVKIRRQVVKPIAKHYLVAHYILMDVQAIKNVKHVINNF